MMQPTVPMNDLKRRFAPLNDGLRAAIDGVLRGGSYILGPSCTAFETAFAAYCGAKHCLGMANGTDALELALRAVGIGPGARVACVANAGMYATTAILANGATPIYVDITAGSMTMSPAALAATLAAGPVDAVIATHLYGQMADMPALLKTAGAVPVIEDCAQAHGASINGRRAGSWGVVGCFSFYPTKNLGALGDGGAVTTSDDAVALKLKRLRQYGWEKKYHSVDVGGRNSRLDEIQAAALLFMLPRLDEWNDQRRRIVARYVAGIRGGKLRFQTATMSPAYVAHLCVVVSDRRAALSAALKRAGIDSDIHYPVPDYRQASVVAQLGSLPPLPETERAVQSILSLPCFPELTDAEVDRVIGAVNDDF